MRPPGHPTRHEVRVSVAARIYKEHRRYVWLSLRRLGVRQADRDDLTHEVFLIVHRRLDSFTGDSRMTTWLFGICMRVAANYRRLRRRTSEISIASPGRRNAADELSAEERLVRRDDLAAAEAIVSNLSPDKQRIFTMFEIEEFSCAEIAEIIGIPIGTVYSRLHAARRAIGKLVSRERR